MTTRAVPRSTEIERSSFEEECGSQTALHQLHDQPLGTPSRSLALSLPSLPLRQTNGQSARLPPPLLHQKKRKKRKNTKNNEKTKNKGPGVEAVRGEAVGVIAVRVEESSPGWERCQTLAFFFLSRPSFCFVFSNSRALSWNCGCLCGMSSLEMSSQHTNLGVQREPKCVL